MSLQQNHLQEEGRQVLVKKNIPKAMKKAIKPTLEMNPSYGFLLGMVILSGLMEIFAGGATWAWNGLVFTFIISITIERVFKPKRKRKK